MNKHRLQITALALFVSHAASAQADDLVTIVQQTLGYDAEVAQARAGFEASKQAIPIARAALLPQIAGGWGRVYNDQDEGFSAPELLAKRVNRPGYAADLRLEQVDRLSASRLRRGAGHGSAGIGGADLDDARYSCLFR